MPAHQSAAQLKWFLQGGKEVAMRKTMSGAGEWRNPAAGRRRPSRARNQQLPGSKVHRRKMSRNGQLKIQSRNNQLATKGTLTTGSKRSNQRTRTLLNLNSGEEPMISTISHTPSPSARHVVRQVRHLRAGRRRACKRRRRRDGHARLSARAVAGVDDKALLTEVPGRPQGRQGEVRLHTRARAAVHGPAQHPGDGDRARRAHRQLLARLHRRPHPLVHRSPAVQQRGSAPRRQPAALLGRKVQEDLQHALAPRDRELRQGRRRRSVLPSRRRRLRKPEGVHHQPIPGRHRLHNGGLHQVLETSLLPAARPADQAGRRPSKSAAAADDDPGADQQPETHQPPRGRRCRGGRRVRGDGRRPSASQLR